MAISFIGRRRSVQGLLKLIYRLLRALWPKPQVRGLHLVTNHSPSIFVANHLGAYGPVTIMSFLPFQLYPWVTHEVTQAETCADYIEKEFFQKELHLRPPLSSALAGLISGLCVTLMRYLQVIPVYKRSRRIYGSLSMSSAYLSQGRNLLVFPEVSDWELNDLICRFDSGFVNIAKTHFEDRDKIVKFYPIAVDRNARTLRFGESIPFDPSSSFATEKRRIVRELQNRICEML